MSSWLDSLSNKWDEVKQSVSEGWDGYLGVEADRVNEAITGAVDQRRLVTTSVPVNQNTATVTPDQYRTQSKSFNWQKAGVIVGALGLAITVAKLVK